MFTRVKNEIPQLLASIMPAGVKNLGVKVHFGRTKKNNSFIPPEHFEMLRKTYNVTFFDTCTLYGGERRTPERHLRVAHRHGFKPAEILNEKDYVRLDEKVYIPARVKEFDLILNAAHFTGHKITGYGGCIKNAAMGMVTAKTKLWIHAAGNISFSKDKCKNCGFCDKCEHLSPEGLSAGCTSCGDCIGNCASVHFGFGKQKEVASRLVRVASVLRDNLKMINFIYSENPTRLCDCMGDNSDSIIKKGFFAIANTDMAAADRAAIEDVLMGDNSYKLAKAQVAFLQKLE